MKFIPQHFLKYACTSPHYGQTVIPIEDAARAANEELERKTLACEACGEVVVVNPVDPVTLEEIKNK